MMIERSRVIPVEIGDELKKSMLDYSMSTLVNRALPDVRDGMKPSQRRILVAMNDLGLGANRQHRKCAHIAGHASGNYHPHGEDIVYPTLVHLAQDFKLRYPLVDGQGNFGSIDGYPPAAMRYTEARMAGPGQEMLNDLEKETVDYRPNYDERLEEPKVLPSAFPNMVCNGAVGIATTMATAIPPHNLQEVADGLVALIDNPELNIAELMEYIKAPDFPTGGIIYGIGGVLDAYQTGRGHLRIRAKADIEEDKTGRETIIITEIPYMVNKTTLLEKMADLVREKRIEGISNIQDESDRDGLRIVVELKRDVVGDVILNQLYKNTQLESTFAANMVALVNGRPQQVTLKHMLQCYIDHRHDVVKRRTEYELRVAEDRAHILEGLILAQDNIDEVIRIIRGSKDTNEARRALTQLKLSRGQLQSTEEQHQLSERQVQAILSMTLQRLTNMEQQKIEDEYSDLVQEIERLRSILDNRESRMQIVKDELGVMREKYGDDRRSEIVFAASEFSIEDLIHEEDMVITISHNGYIKRIPVSTYRAQNRGGRGITGMRTKDEDFVESLFVASTHSYILVLTDRGHCVWLKVHEIPRGTRQARGRPIVNVVDIPFGHKVAEVVPVREFDEDRYLLSITRKGLTKKTALSAYSRPRKGGIIAMNVREDDQLIKAAVTGGDDQVIIATKNGQAVYFDENKVRAMGRNSQGVRGVSLQGDDVVVGMVVVRPEELEQSHLLTVCANGYGKRTPVSDYRLTNRGVKGVINIKTTDRNGPVVSMMGVMEDSRDDMVIVTQNGILIRQKVADVSVIGRNAQGVRLINPDDGDQVIDVAQVINQDEEEEGETAMDATSEEVSETGDENTAEENGTMKALWREVQKRTGWK
ncbi:MAG: DNA gyrase subunit A [Gemmatimonadetes bacterium]|nr:DNA gyrase subunit A [Gemmatimonadota bacterium]MYF73842.1 DNA gyrase subunit A [Gemmatimonadota bacterium]MYK53221.1 DNA gyrase subunit A [Gemmatimonadota bacterium]